MNRKFCFRYMYIAAMLFALSSVEGLSQGWNASPFSQKVFIENNGQVNEKTNTRATVLFTSSQNGNGMDLYWSNKGLTYKITGRYLSEEARKEILEENDPDAVKEHVRVKYHYLTMEWVGSNPSAEIIKEETVSNYFTYADPNDKSGRSGIKAAACKKIIYKNIYQGIDVEYILPEKGGVKYAFTVHPGADPSGIKMRYTGADKIVFDSEGNVRINSKKCGDYLEHKPVTYYEDGSPVVSGFSIQGNILGFTIPEYDKSRTIVIDPWVSVVNFPPGTNPSASAYNTSGYDVGYDNAGNVWVYGGADPVYLAKYNSTGTLLWTYSVPFSAWDLVGDFDLNRISGTAYVCAGSDCPPSNPGGLPAGIVKVNSQGIQTGKFNGNNMNYEISRIRLDCSGKLYMTGGGIQGGLWQVAGIDTNLTAVTGKHITSSPNGDHDECLMTLDPTGNFMYVNFNHAAANSVDFLHDNEMQKIPLPAYAPAAWINPGPIYHFLEMGSLFYTGIADGGTVQNGSARLNMFNGMVCGNRFLYTYNGDTLKQWDKSTGTLIRQIRTGGTIYVSGGLDLDLCEHVYAGVSNRINEYDDSLNLIKTYPLSNTTCYDLKVDKNQNLLYACGKGYVSALSLATPPVKNLITSSTPASCALCNGTAAATFSVSTTACNTAFTYSYKWLPGGQTTPSITGLCAGTYSVIAIASKDCINEILDTAVVIIPGGASPQADFVTSPVCFNSAPSIFTDHSVGNTTISNWDWDFGDGSSSVQQNPSHTYASPGVFQVTLIVTNTSGCKDTITYPAVVNPLPVASFSTAPVCQGSPSCFTDQSVISAGSVSSWSWNFGDPGSGSSNTSPLQNPCHTYNGPGSYSVILTVTSDSGCQGVITHPVTINPKPAALIKLQNACLNTITQFSDGSTSADPIVVWNWDFGDGSTSAQQNPGHTYSSAGSYTITLNIVTQKGCRDSTTSVVTVYPLPVANYSDSVKGCAPQDYTFKDLSVVNGGTITSWQWSFPGGTPSTSTQSNPTVHWGTPGAYNAQLIVTSNHGCKDTLFTPMYINIYAYPTAEFCVNPGVAPAADPRFSFCDMWSKDVIKWTWDFGDGSPLDSINTDPVHSYTATVNNNDFYKYTVCIHVENQHSCPATICHEVELIPEFVFYIPNTFTPNGDNINELFYGKSRGVKEYNIWVFDRWGNQIWHCRKEDKNTNWDSDQTSPRQEGLSSSCKWDGVVVAGGADMSGDSREIAQQDVYVWKVQLLDIFDKRHTYVGHVNIIK